jgi:hypothetical protein
MGAAVFTKWILPSEKLSEKVECAEWMASPAATEKVFRAKGVAKSVPCAIEAGLCALKSTPRLL